MASTRKYSIAAGAVTAMVMALAACGSSDDGDSGDGGGAKKLKVMMFPSQVYRLPAVVAQDKGIFEKNGLDVEFVDQPTNLQGAQAMEATGADVGQHSLATVAQGFQSGDRLKYFCGTVDVIQTSLAAKPGSDFPKVSDGASWQDVLKSLEGKKVGVQTPVGSGTQLLFAAALDEVGVKKVTYVNVGTDMATARASLANGSVDVVQLTPPVLQTMVADKKAEQLVYLPDGPSTYKETFGSGWTTPADSVADNEEALTAYCDSMTEALTMIHDDKQQDDIAGILAKDTGVDESIAKQVLEDGTYDDHDSTLDTDRVQSTLDLYVDLDIIKKSPKVTAEDITQDVSK